MNDPQARTVTIQLNAPTASDLGEQTASWSDVAGAVRIPMRVRNRKSAPVAFGQVAGGVAQTTRRFGILDAVRPTLDDQHPALYRVVDCDSGETWQVVSIDVYAFNTQIGLENVA